MNNISVVIATYNRKELLLRALDSVFSQTINPMEVIVIDDRSNFNVEDFLKDKYDARVIRNTTNVGGAESRNIGVRHAKGDFIAFLDSDDYWAPSKLKMQSGILDEFPETGLVYCDQWVVQQSGNILESNKTLIDNNIWEHLLEGWTAPNTSTLLIKKKIFEKVGGFDSKLTSCQDHDLWMRLAIMGIIVKYLPEKLSYFTMDADNRISFNSNKRIQGAIGFLEKWKSKITKARDVNYYKGFRNDYLYKVIFPIFLSSIKNQDFIRTCGLFIKYLALNPAFYVNLSKAFRRKVLAWKTVQ